MRTNWKCKKMEGSFPRTRNSVKSIQPFARAANQAAKRQTTQKGGPSRREYIL